ncbi:hypothetical protein [Mucilaginibacter terrae]|uniref:Uncharacterized protein n=1 Tax=Mucilaginibacter terrae TaxID=1955052 RepID=A0ABU3GSG2_9SPHI|nr:hypothetical protein [Mucilaginibacter terrae]MDT3402699.1 hypothetical protein [Mucilaginibacter terrae]
MSKSAWLVIALFMIIVLAFTLSVRTGYNLVLPVTASHQSESIKAGQDNNSVKLFSNIDFKKGNWAAYLVLKNEDWQGLHPSILKRTCLKTTDKHVLNYMQNNWQFKVSDADIATVSSSFYLLHDGKIVYETAIVLDAVHQGLQNAQYGWMEPVKPDALIKVCSQFKPVYWPVVIL